MTSNSEDDTTTPLSSEVGAWLSQAAILVVDDEPGMRNFVARSCGRAAGRGGAGDGRQASQLIEQQNFDIVILDNVMPGQNGLDWLAEQRRQGFFSDVILMTATPTSIRPSKRCGPASSISCSSRSGRTSSSPRCRAASTDRGCDARTKSSARSDCRISELPAQQTAGESKAIQNVRRSSRASRRCRPRSC